MYFFRYGKVIFALLFLLPACSAEKEPSLSGEAVISTRLYGNGPYYAYGFSFVEARKILYPNSKNTHVDLVGQALTDVQGNVTGIMLASPDNEHAFYINGKFEDTGSAKAFYDSYSEVTARTFVALSDTLFENEVLTYRSIFPTYAKILISSIKILPDNLTGQYVEVTFRWSYQPNGSTVFP